MNNKLILAVVGVVVAVLGGYFTFFNDAVAPLTATGDTNSSARIAQVSLDMSTTTPTTYSSACKLYNGDSQDRIISSITYYLAGLGTMTGSAGTGVATLNWTAGTSTGIYVVPTAASMVLNTTVATGTPQLFIASTTPGSTGSAFARVWASGTCLNVLTNATSSTASGVVRVDYSVAP